MEHLSVNQSMGRRRGLSVSTVTENEKKKMGDVLDELKDDLQLVKTSWKEDLNKDSNPLELALLLLDNTSVGLGHRFNEFKSLKSKIEYDLQKTVNEHYQAFNSNISSYRDLVQLISSSQEQINTLRNRTDTAIVNITKKHESLESLNEDHIRKSKVIEILNALETIVAYPAQIDKAINSKNFSQAQDLLSKSFNIANANNLWKLKACQTIKQQLEMQQKNLFELIVEEVECLIYVKNSRISDIDEIFNFPKFKSNDFSDLENYFYQISNIDVIDKSEKINESLVMFLKELGSPENALNVVKDVDQLTTYEKIYQYMIVINDMNELHTALEIFYNRTTEELHNVIVKTTENIRLAHPVVMKILATLSDSSSISTSRNLIYVVLKEFFWEIFSKFLFAVQAHRAVYEIMRSLQPPGSDVGYDLGGIWNKILTELENFLDIYVNDSENEESRRITDKSNGKVLDNIENDKKDSNSNKIFSLTNTIEGSSKARGHATEMKKLLQDMFPGFSSSTNFDTESIYLKEEAYEQEETLVKPSAFNMKFILESLLLFIQGSNKAIPSSLFQNTQSPLVFFDNYMKHKFFRILKRTLYSMSSLKLTVVNPYLLEQLDDASVVFKIAKDFKVFFQELLTTFNTSENYKPQLADVFISLLTRFFNFLKKFFVQIISKNRNSRSILSIWVADEELKAITLKLQDNPASDNKEGFHDPETDVIFKHCPKFFDEENTLLESDLLSLPTVENILHLVETLDWLTSWLDGLKKEVTYEPISPNVDVDILKRYWTFYENMDLDELETREVTKFCLAEDRSKNFDKTLGTYKDLLNTCLLYLRYDIRAKCMYYISKAINNTEWCTETTALEVSNYITSLDSELYLEENMLINTVSQRERNFIFKGLTSFCSNVLISSSQSMSSMNSFGYKKLMKNIETLQKSLRGLADVSKDKGLEYCFKYYNLFEHNENRIIDNYNKGYYDEFYDYNLIKNIIRLKFSENIKKQAFASQNKNGHKQIVSSLSANKRYSEIVKKLNKH
ncbi:related to Exocyst complex component SEC8 [Saccharomycodes ludwigii]|uniref:Exocyst complex component Sec8 n=1 Tax=Saccharomycodes ludwigii TaxID=36035 RepID=A0A376B529_9ASCO|nr:related to Exocyst complex component SEC8 [Saccharomycodes ludwigii]